jgi:hypothetical protein
MMPFSRRSFLLSSFSFLAVPTMGFAETEKTRFEYIPSKLGIDYRALAPTPLAEMLSQGEVEWMENAVVDYGEDTEGAWVEEIAPQVATGAISQITIENLREFTPQMLIKFTALDFRDSKYSGLWSVGTNYVARKLAGKS